MNFPGKQDVNSGKCARMFTSGMNSGITVQ